MGEVEKSFISIMLAVSVVWNIKYDPIASLFLLPKRFYNDLIAEML